MTFRQKVFNIINEKNQATKLSQAFDIFIVGLIVLNVVAIILESFKGLKATYAYEFYCFEIFSVVVFTVEYLLRLFTADFKYPNQPKVKAVVSFATSPTSASLRRGSGRSRLAPSVYAMTQVTATLKTCDRGEGI